MLAARVAQLVHGCFLQRRYTGSDPDPLCVITALKDRTPPVTALEIPRNGFFNAGFKALAGVPAKLGFNLRRVDGITPVVARPVMDESYQRASGRAFAGRQAVQMIADLSTICRLVRSFFPPML